MFVCCFYLNLPAYACFRFLFLSQMTHMAAGSYIFYDVRNHVKYVGISFAALLFGQERNIVVWC